MTHYSISAIVESPASQPGALDALEARCSCGLVMRSSMRTLLEADVVAHAAYHERRGDVVEPETVDRRAGRVEDVYNDLKLRDRLTPGRTPWQRLKAEAEAIVAREEGDTFSPKVARVIDEARSAFVWGIGDAATRRAAVAELARSFGFEVSDAGTVELEAAAAELGVEL